MNMETVIKELETLFDEAKQKSEFDFVLTLINYRGMGTPKLTTNLHEWFDAITFYKKLYKEFHGKEKTRIACLIYSIFFENSDFYNIIGSLCKIKLGYKGSSYLFYKTKKYERLLGIGEKQEFLLELLSEVDKNNIIFFFKNNHHKEIRNAFFHSAYSLSEKEFILHDSDPIIIDGVGQSAFEIETFFYPKVENILAFFEAFKKCFLDSFDSYQEDKQVQGRFPNPVQPIILGSKQGLKGFVIKNAVSFYGQTHDSGIMYDEKYDLWAGRNITMYFQNIESIEINDLLTRYEKDKDDIRITDAEFQNLSDKVIERQNTDEIKRIVQLHEKFGNAKYSKMQAEQDPFKKRSFPRIILPFYQKAVDLGTPYFDMANVQARIQELSNLFI